jgi:NAD(P)-dependent dehydrogenase (short-subunit alcohol dehydrogenase family)
MLHMNSQVKNSNNMEYKTAVVTGAASGVGLALTQALLLAGWKVGAVIRSKMPDDMQFENEIATGRLVIFKGDLANKDSRSKVIQEIANELPKIDTLFNNAGVSPGELTYSPQQNELCFEVNTLAPYMMLQGLRKNLAASGKGCVVNTSSSVFMHAKSFAPQDLLIPTAPYRKLFGAYLNSKLALSLWSWKLAEELKEDGIKIISVDPGANKTQMTRGSGMPLPLLILSKLFFKPPSHGASLLLSAATSTTVNTGDFLIKGKPTIIPFLDRASQTLEIVRTTADA